jgi:hypothetical protein
LRQSIGCSSVILKVLGRRRRVVGKRPSIAV